MSARCDLRVEIKAAASLGITSKASTTLPRLARLQFSFWVLSGAFAVSSDHKLSKHVAAVKEMAPLCYLLQKQRPLEGH